MSFKRIERAFAARLAGAFALLLAALVFAAPAEASYKVRLDYVRTAPGNQPGVFFGTENVSGAGSTPVLSLGRTDLTLGGSPASAQVRVTVISGAVVLTMPASSPTGGETKGVRLQAGDPAMYVPIGNGQVMAFTEAADGPTSTGGGGGAVTGAAASFVDGWSVTLGAEADAACSNDVGTCTQMALMKRLNQRASTIIANQPALNGDGGALSHLTNPGVPDQLNTGTIAAGTANAAYTVNLANGEGVVGFKVSGLTAAGATLTVEASNDGGATWSAINTVSPATGALSTTVAADGQFRVNSGGHTNVRLRVSTTGSGTVSVASIASSTATLHALSSPLPAGGNLIGGVSIADGADVTLGSKGDAAWSGTGAASLVAIAKQLHADMVAPTPAGTNVIGSVTGGTSSLGPWTFNANNQSNSFNAANYGAVSVQLANTSFNGTLKLQFSNDNVNWYDGEGTSTAVSNNFGVANGMPVHGSFPGNGYNGLYVFPVLGTYARVVTTAYTSGSIVATVQLLANQPGIRSVYSLGNPIDQNPSNLGNATMVGGTSAASGQVGGVSTWGGGFFVANLVNSYTDSTTTLGSAATFTGTARSLAATNGGAMPNYFNAQSYADQTGTLQIQETLDNGATWQTVAQTAATANSVATARVAITGAVGANTQYRVQYVNGSTAQGLFRLASSMTAN